MTKSAKKILWITWKDIAHPAAGGAEVVCDQICRRLVADGYEVTMLTTNYPGATDISPTEGVKVIRVGANRYLHPLLAFFYYITHLRHTFDVVVEEVNGAAAYFAVWFGRKSRRYMLYHQLGRINWLYEVPKPFSYVGYYLLAPFATRVASAAGTPLITVSESTKQELAKYGFKPNNTHIISEGLTVEALPNLASVRKYQKPTVLSHGTMRAMKRTIDQIKAFELAKKSIPNLHMKISGSSSGAYGQQVMQYISESPFKNDIEYLGRITDEQKRTLMQRCHAILVTSIEEGWGLIVTEANSQGTPAVVYNVAGLRDSVRHEQTGLLTNETPKSLAQGIVKLLSNQEQYQTIRKNGWQWSKEMTFDKSYEDFRKAVGLV